MTSKYWHSVGWRKKYHFGGGGGWKWGIPFKIWTPGPSPSKLTAPHVKLEDICHNADPILFVEKCRYNRNESISVLTISSFNILA